MSIKPEILAPAGSMESLISALRCGADAVYIGAKSFSARQNATNFDNDELKEACELAHKSGAKIYQTINTLFFDSQQKELERAIAYSAEIGIDALIIQDLGALYLARKILPDMPLHASTQMTIHTQNGALTAKELGFSRVILSREMSGADINKIAKLGIETEVFVHGALCMSVSGQCYMSAMIGSRSANRGLCAQACRLPFSAVFGEKRCDLSLKDMCHIPHISKLLNMGVSSLKIEGRMKRPEYVAAAVTACRAAINGEEPDLDTLQAVFSRSGFTDGYFSGKTGEAMFGTRNKEDVVSATDVLPALSELYRKERKAASVSFDLKLKLDKPSELTVTDDDGKSTTVTGEAPQPAINRPTDLAQAEKQLSKLGGTIYEYKSAVADIDDGLMLPASALNELRRTAIESLDTLRIKENTIIKTVYPFDEKFPKSEILKKPRFRLDVKTAAALDGANISEVEAVTIPLDQAEKATAFIDKSKLILSLPRYMKNESEIANKLKALKASGFERIECQNLAHIKTGRELGMKMSGGYGLNITNSLALKQLSELGVSYCQLSFECTLDQIEKLSSQIPIGVIGYGRLALMLTVNCPIKQAVGCKSCTHKLTDRTGRSFPVICDENACEIFNSDVLFMADRLTEIKGASFITLKFTNESADEINKIIHAYKSGEKPSGEFTRGLYYRGII